MKKLLLALFLLGTFLNTEAQFGLTAGIQTSFIRSSSFEEFKTSYGNYLASQLKEVISNPSPRMGWAFGIDAELAGFYGFANFNKSYAAVDILFSDNSIRHLDFRQFASDIGIGYARFTDRFSFGLGGGIVFGEDKTISYFEYTDGTISYAIDKELNGIYDGIHVGWAGHLMFSVGLTDNIHWYSRAQYLFGSLAGIGGPLGDLMTHKSQNAVAGENNKGLPTDYEEFIQNQGSFLYPDDQYVSADFSGLRIETGIRIQFGGL